MQRLPQKIPYGPQRSVTGILSFMVRLIIMGIENF